MSETTIGSSPVMTTGERIQRTLAAALRAKETGTLGALLLMSLALSLTTRAFLTEDNLFDVIRGFSFVAIAGLGQIIVMLTGGIDLSVGSAMGFAGWVASLVLAGTSRGSSDVSAETFAHGFAGPLNVPVSLVIALAAGGAIGAINGFLITKLRLAPFIATLGTLGIFRGILVGFTEGWTQRIYHPQFLFLGQGYIARVPVPIIFMVVLCVIVFLFLTRTIWGTHIFAVGGGESASKMSGVPVDHTKFLAYVLCGMLAGMGGILLSAKLGVAMPTAGQGYELDVIAAVVIGGTSLKGGEGSIWGVLIGAAIMGILRNGLVLWNVPAYWRESFIGLVIIAAAALDQFRSMRRA
jgi:ribose transport system permease protein